MTEQIIQILERKDDECVWRVRTVIQLLPNIPEERARLNRFVNATTTGIEPIQEKTPVDPVSHATMMILLRISKQAEFKEVWQNLENAERNYICGDIFNLVKTAREST